MSQDSTKNLGGRPRAYIDYEKLEKLCHIHCTGEECAAILDVDYDTLNRNLINDGHGGFAEYFKKYSANGKASLRRRQLQAAMDGNATMLVWMGKQLLGQSDKQDVIQEITHKGELTLAERLTGKCTQEHHSLTLCL